LLELLLLFTFLFVVSLMLTLKGLIIKPRRDLEAVVKETLGEQVGKEEKFIDYTEADKEQQKQKIRVPFIERLEQEAVKAGLAIKPREFLLIAMIAAVLGFIAGMILTGGPITALPFMAVGIYAPRWYLNSQKKKRIELFDRQLEKALMLASNTLKAGQSLIHAIDAIAEQMPDPLGGEFRRAQREIRLGVLPEQALKNIQKRVESAEFNLTLMAIQIQSQVGGNLVEIFDIIAETIRERISMKQAVHAATAQGRVSGTVIGVLPFVVFGIIYLVDPGYLAPFMRSATGRFVFLICTAMILTGWWMIRRITNIEFE